MIAISSKGSEHGFASCGQTKRCAQYRSNCGCAEIGGFAECDGTLGVERCFSRSDELIVDSHALTSRLKKNQILLSKLL